MRAVFVEVSVSLRRLDTEGVRVEGLILREFLPGREVVLVVGGIFQGVDVVAWADTDAYLVLQKGSGRRGCGWGELRTACAWFIVRIIHFVSRNITAGSDRTQSSEFIFYWGGWRDACIFILSYTSLFRLFLIESTCNVRHPKHFISDGYLRVRWVLSLLSMNLTKYLLLSHSLLSSLFQLYIDLFLHEQSSPSWLLSEQRQELSDISHRLFRVLIRLQLLSEWLRGLLTLQVTLFVVQVR